MRLTALVGKETKCKMRRDGKTVTGTALLETSELIFRAKDARAVWPLKELRSVVAKDGELRFSHEGEAIALALGDQAAKWASAILNPKTRAEKLGVKRGERVTLLRVKDEAIAGELKALGADVSTRLRKESDAIFVQIDAPAGLARLAALRESVAQDGAVWTITPRGVAGVKDTDVMAAAKTVGLVDVKVVRFSATHSANKFVIPRAART